MKKGNSFDEDYDLEESEDNEQNITEEDYKEEEFPEQYHEFDEALDDFYEEEEDELLGTKTRRKRNSDRKKRKEFYVKKQDLMDEIAKYQQSKKEHPDQPGYISEALGDMVLKICTRFSLHPKFYGYSYREEMVADAVMRCLSKRIR